MPTVQDRVLDYGLTEFHTLADKLFINSTEATTYTQATATYALGNKNYGAPNAVGNPAAGAPNGRKVTVAAITDGSVTAGGTAGFWAIVDSANSRLLATGTLSASQVVTQNNVFTLGAFDIRLPGA